MAYTHIYRTSGDFVAFRSGDNLFSPSSEWLGYFLNGNELYSSNGDFVGYLTNDDRIARNTLEAPRVQLIPPVPPVPPLPPIPPLDRLQMTPLPYPYEDVFQKGSLPSGSAPFGAPNKSYDYLLESHLMANDGVFLGVVSRNRYDANSLTNRYGTYGSRYNPNSIFNPYGQYGSVYSRFSPYNQYTQTPPYFQSGNHLLGLLSRNQYLSNQIDTNDFLLWLGAEG